MRDEKGLDLVDAIRNLEKLFTASGLVQRVEIAPRHWKDFRDAVILSPWVSENLKYRVDHPMPTRDEFQLMGVTFARAK